MHEYIETLAKMAVLAGAVFVGTCWMTDEWRRILAWGLAAMLAGALVLNFTG